MGRPSDKRHSARRLGKRERERVKRHQRGTISLLVGGGVEAHVKAGQKKRWKVYRWVNKYVDVHLSGESTLKSAVSIERPLYKIEISPPL